MKLAVVETLGVLAQQGLCTALYFLVVALRIFDLNDVVRHGLGVRRFVLNRLQRRQRFVVFLLFVHAVRVVIRTAGLVAALAFGELTEVDRRPLVLLHHQVRVPAIEGVVLLVRPRQGVDVDRLQDLQRLFVVPFLHLQHALHEMDLIQKRGVRISLQVCLQVALQ